LNWLNKICMTLDNAIKQGHASIVDFEAGTVIDYISANNIEYQNVIGDRSIWSSIED
jgi:hypothetical protein